MSALTTGKAIKTRWGDQFIYPAKAGAKCFAGGIAVLVGGFAAPASTAVGLRCVGHFEQDADNGTGADGAITVQVRREAVLCVNSTGADEVTNVQVNNVCYLVDDQTVAATDGGGTRSAAGRVLAVGVDGVWVALGQPGMAA